MSTFMNNNTIPKSNKGCVFFLFFSSLNNLLQRVKSRFRSLHIFALAHQNRNLTGSTLNTKKYFACSGEAYQHRGDYTLLGGCVF